ncbi:glycosyltransferase family 4 protein [Nisaea acidiphila]|uniref:Glycosyltransferase family 4 protein n=1 Tax=Nisaea acidiphila TaxID=1862145 RepID=A0A9J7AKJ3_9PROT|nr:glycosyltransferase family 4 protein [Nisaea acidiphila]UUX48008.1 glycosyltransferase family 4 protein [Nisaea acidiphila]
MTIPGASVPTAIVLKGYPRLSETFIAQEILELQTRGLDFTLVSLRHPTDKATHPVHGRIRAAVNYLPEYLYQEPLRVLRAWWKVRRLPGYGAVFRLWLKDLRRDPTPNRGRRFGQAMVLAAELDPHYRHIYAHFLHTPSSVARYAALMTGRSWSASAHAKDIWLSPEWEKREKLEDAAWAVTCTRYGHAHLDGLVPGKTRLVYHGLDLSSFASPVREPSERDGSGDPVRLLSVGRAVPKKGFDRLLEAMARLPEGLAWHWTHIGGGKELGALKEQAGRLGISGHVTWRGAAAQSAVIEACREADLFVLPSRVAEDGDRDGLPNVLMEAQSQRLCCLATEVSAIPELIEDGVTGALVPPDDGTALTSALEGLIRDPVRRARLAAAGEERVRGRFDHRTAIATLADLLGLGPAEAESGTDAAA